MAKKDLQEEAKAKGVEITGKETIPQLNKLIAEADELEKAVEEVNENLETAEETAKEVAEAAAELPSITERIIRQVAETQRRHDEWKALNGVK